MVVGTEPSALAEIVQEAIDQGSLGSPMFVRCFAQVVDAGEIEAASQSLVTLAEGWFGSSPVQRHRIGDSHTYVTELLKWRDGQGALLTISSGTPHVDLMLVGSRGTLYHEA